MTKQEILRKHLGQTEAEFQDTGKKNTLEAMEEYAQLYHNDKMDELSKVKCYNCGEIVNPIPLGSMCPSCACDM